MYLRADSRVESRVLRCKRVRLRLVPWLLTWTFVGPREVAGIGECSGRFLKIRVSAVRFRPWPWK
jgi:hypothetical protein